MPVSSKHWSRINACTKFASKKSMPGLVFKDFGCRNLFIHLFIYLFICCHVMLDSGNVVVITV